MLPPSSRSLLLSSDFSPELSRSINEWLFDAPFLACAPIALSTEPDLRAYRGQLFSGTGPGSAVHAASFLRRREVVLERQLLLSDQQFRFILLHELFHFAWFRLSNGGRAAWEQLVAFECRKGARGEMGDSAMMAKAALRPTETGIKTSRKWKNYVCESFCDTGASYNGGNTSAGLADRWRRARWDWFTERQAEAKWRI